jgi:hypothetical protein
MSDPVLQGNNPYLYFQADRDPTATEPVIVSSGILPTGYFFFWWNTTTNSLFLFGGGTSGSFVWDQDVTASNLLMKLAAAGIGPIPPADHIDDAATDAATNAPTNLNVLTTLLGNLTGEVNATNAKQNALAAKYNDLALRFNTLLGHLESQGLQLTS